MVINKKANKYIEIFCFTDCIFLLNFVVAVFVSSIISITRIPESSMILANYLPFSQLNVAGF